MDNAVVPVNLQMSLFANSVFEQLRHFDEYEREYWIAREMMKEFEYTEWRNFGKVIERTKEALRNGGEDVNHHIVGFNNMIETGKGAKRKVDDFKLSRLACYLIAQNGDPDKPQIALAQIYFAVKTRQQELAEQSALEDTKKNQAIVGYQMSGKTRDWALPRIESKTTQKALISSMQQSHVDHNPNYGALSAEQNRGLFDMTKQQIIDYLGLLPKDEKNYRDHLGKYALMAINMANSVIVDRVKALKRPLTDEEQAEIVKEVTRRIAPTMRDLAQYASIDYLSGATLTESNVPMLSRNVRLLPKGS